jgi:hypothetical protein
MGIVYSLGSGEIPGTPGSYEQTLSNIDVFVIFKKVQLTSTMHDISSADQFIFPNVNRIRI